MAGEVKSTKKRKKGKAWIIILVVVVVIAAIFILPRFLMPENANIASVYSGDIYVVQPRTVEDTISATGLVESHEDTTAKVYSTLTYKIDTVNVSLGDKVNEGDVLCVYDTETLDRSIKEKELSMSSSRRSASLNLATAKMNYDTYLAGVENGTNATISNAQSNYDSALEKYEQAKADYEEYIAKNDSSEIITLNSAKRDLDKAQKDYDDYLAEIKGGTNTSLSTAKRTLDKAQKDYDDLKYEIENGTNLQLITAKRSLDTALENYEDYKDMMEDDQTAELLNASAALDKADDSYEEAVDLRDTYEESMDKAYDEWQKILADPEASDVEKNKAEQRYETAAGKYKSQVTIVARLHEQYILLEDAYDNAYDAADMTLKSYKTTYDNAKDNYDSVVKSLDDQLESYEKALGDAADNYNSVKSNMDTQLENYEVALKKAEDNYQNALDAVDDQIETYETMLTNAKRTLDDAALALSNAEITVNDQLENYHISYQNAKNGTDTSLADYQLANLYEDLAKTTVKAPISGTVTAVYAVEGESASGVMFVIEDTSNLVVTSTVKAYDLDDVFEGMKVKIETDASGDEEFYGVVESIAPTASKDATGNIVATNDAEFETVVAIDGENEKLRIGVSAQIQ
ncbi:MAG: efflux RND transporter periplasmic adaptor subunit, partial [Clostridia bacterium]|nr:efflux RND transporter periplasmic adaptor subunit [Clostridia bacterium]